MSFDPKVYLSKRTGGFDPKAYLQKKGATEEPGAIQSFLTALDSYTGAPARAGVGAVMDGNNPISAVFSQIGEDPELAPTPRELSARMGLSKTPLYSGKENDFAYDPEFAADAGFLSQVSPEDVGTVGIGLGADLTNLIPLVGPAAKVISGGAKAVRGGEAVAAAAKAAEGVEVASNAAKGSRVSQIGSKLSKRKVGADEIEAAAREIGAPVLPGQVLDGQLLQRIESTLQNSPTLVGQSQREVADTGYEALRNALSSSLENQNLLSEVELGNQLKASFAEKIASENAPLAELYERIRQSHQAIPIAENSGKAISRNIGKIKDARLSPSSSASSIVKRVQSEISNLKSVDDVKEYRTMLRKSLPENASKAERSVVANIDRRLKALEEGTVVRAGKKLSGATEDPVFAQEAKRLIGERKNADKSYSDLMGKIETIGGKLGIKSPEGAKGFIEKLDDLTPERVTRKLFDKNDSEFLKEMNEIFPEEVGAIFDFEKSKILERATKDFKVNPAKVLEELNKLSPEAQALMFTPEQLKKIKAAKTYSESLPKNANPSGTAFTQDLLTFTNNPIKAPLANARDLALKKFLESASKGDSLGAEAFTRFGSVAKEAGRKAHTAAERSRQSLRLAALERTEGGSSSRKSYSGPDRKKLIRRKALGD
jgi:hypothetical protein